jgi:phosphatidylethanolamine-binding protein (PEBP) family uncharacterized protein
MLPGLCAGHDADRALGADRDTLLDAMKGHVLAKGELVGTYAQKQKPLK